MRLLVFTQKIDKNDPVLGFFHSWVREFSSRCESVEVICLEKGGFDLPENVTVYSLGKENRASRFVYVKNLYKYLSLISGSYDDVFVHMNQEYVLLAGLYWKLKRIPVYLWRNHKEGSFLTRIAVVLSNKVFCTSKDSFTAKFDKTVVMPAGIDTGLFKPPLEATRKKYSVCMIGRVSPVKNIHTALESVNILVKNGTQISLAVIGPTPDRDSEYLKKLKKYVADNSLSTSVSFDGPISPEKLPEVYSKYEICLNLTDSGSFDKTIIEASSCGTVPVVSNESFRDLLPDVCITKNNPEKVASSIERLLDPSERVKIQKDLRDFAESQSLSKLMNNIFLEIK